MAHLLDTSALLAHYRNEAGAKQVQALFDLDGEELMVASVSLPEFARRLRDLGMGTADIRSVITQYQQAIGTVVAVDAAVAEASFDLICELSSRLPLVDSIIAAAARSRGARLVHRDMHMRAIPPNLLDQLDLEACITHSC
jgi:predicted nucleic acid-binding protein